MYGILISLGIFTATLTAEKIVKTQKKIEHLWGLVLYAVIAGIIGARIYHILGVLDYYLRYPLQILAVWNGGLGIFGAIFGGILGITIYTKTHKLNLFYWLDVAAIVTPLAQSIARWGNYFNQELFGKPTSLPWAIYIPKEKRPEEYLYNETFHPLFLYESILNLSLFIFLFKMQKSKKIKLASSKYTSIYFLGYSVIRFSLEFIKFESWAIYGINVAQGISVILAGLAILYLSGMLKFKHDIHRK